jgi:hypothetical protein
MNEKPQLMKFSDMPQGTHFTDGRRNFIKLQTLLPSGLTQKTYRLPEGCETPLECNSVDYKGSHATCPDWLEFKLLAVTAKDPDPNRHKAI